jgi:hypothetical protein
MKKKELEEANEKDTETNMDELFQDFLEAEEFGKNDSDDEDAAPRAEKIFTKRGSQVEAKKKKQIGGFRDQAAGGSGDEADDEDMMDHESADSYYDDDDEEGEEMGEGSMEEDSEGDSDIGDSAEMDSDMDSEQGFDYDDEDMIDSEEMGEYESGDEEEEDIENDDSDQQSQEASQESAEEEAEQVEEEPKTDIFGRPAAGAGGAYVPPHLRRLQQGAPKYDEKTIAMRKELRGLINRLSEPNLTKIASAIEELLKKSSRGGSYFPFHVRRSVVLNLLLFVAQP